MKRFLKVVGIASILSAFAFTTASCSNATQSYADKINNEAKDDDNKYITYEQAKKKLGKECIDITVAIGDSRNGVLVAVKGCKSKEEIQAKIDNGDTVEGIYIVVLNSNCTNASYKTITSKDLK